MRCTALSIQQEKIKISIKLEIQSFIDKNDSLDYYKGFMMGLYLNNLISRQRYYSLIRLARHVENGGLIHVK